MRRLPFVLAALLMAGCDHHKSANQAQSEAGNAPVVQTDAPYTGQNSSPAKTYPRAKPVAEEPETAATSETTPPIAPVAPAPLTDSAPGSVAVRPPSEAPMPEEQTEQVVLIQTSLGRIVIELDDSAAPKTCENFRKLVADGFYNHTVFHRVIPNFIVQGGDPNSKGGDRISYGQGGPGYTLPAEIKLAHDRGAVAMARLPDSVNPQRESNGSQFYICVAPCPSLDNQYTVFGHVIKGMDVVARISGQSRDKRDNPLTRLEMEASLQPKDKALAESSAVNP